MAIIAGLVPILSVGCQGSQSAGVPDSPPPPWVELRQTAGYQIIAETSGACRDCLRAQLVTVLGDTDGPGHFAREPSHIIRDIAGNFWVGQRGFIKIYDASGSFLRDIGQLGQGPMDFERPRPFHTDLNGRVHILDPSNSRVTLVDASFEMSEMRTLPGYVQDAVPVADGARYIARMWMRTPDLMGLPLHLIEGPEVLRSFGAPPTEDAEPQDSFTSRRLLAVAPWGQLFTSKPFEYSLDVWTFDGQRVTGFRGPTLNEDQVLPGRWTNKNPPATRIYDIGVDKEARLWVLSWQRKSDWQDNMVEVIAPDGRVAMIPKDEMLTNIYEGRIDIVDLRQSSLIARVVRKELFLSLLGDGLVATARYATDGNPTLGIYHVSIN